MAFRKCMIVLLVALASLALVSCSGEKCEPRLSAGLDVLAERAQMTKTGLVGDGISFEATDFERALNVSSLSSITITSLPSRADGILYLGSGEVSEGQVISRENIGYLTFVCGSGEVRDSAFCFSTDGAYVMTCNLYLLDSINYSPTLSEVPEEALAVSTYENIAVYGTLSSKDPEGDAVRYEIVTRPQKGLLVLEDVSCGTYRYVPNAGYTGKDSFRYVAVDRYGNYSEARTVSVRVERADGIFVFRDLANSEYHVPAIALTERGIMSSTEIGGEYYFYPSKTVSRAEFLTMAMKTLGIQPDGTPVKTVFADDELIPAGVRGYVNAAQKRGYVCGKLGKNGELLFAPDDPITTAEAAVILLNMTEAKVPDAVPVFAEGSTVPTWASEAIYTMASMGVIDAIGSFDATESLTRGGAAAMLYRLGRLGGE